MCRWIHPEKLRYYQADLVLDLFGDWTLVTTWGGLGTARGSRRIAVVESEQAGWRALAALDARRQKRGYLQVASFGQWMALVEVPTGLRPAAQMRRDEMTGELDLAG